MEQEKNVNETVAASESNMTKSQKKRADRKKKNEKIKADAMLTNVIGIVIAAVIIAGIAYGVGSSIMKRSQVITPNSNYSLGLNENNGYIKGVTASNAVTIPADYDSIVIPAADVEYTEEEFEEEKEKQLSSHQVLNTESTAAVEDGNKVNIDYVGSIDGVEFEGGNTNGSGSDVSIGSGMLIDDFEQQIIGHKVGDEFDVNVTFPEDYSAADLAGKDALFKVTLNGIYEDGVFDDDFVAENLKAYATTVDEYFEYKKDEAAKDRLSTAVLDYLKNNTTVNSIPKKYLKILKSTKKYSDQRSYEYMNEMYKSYYGQGYSSFEDYTGQTEEEYDLSLEEDCTEEAKLILIYQSIAEKQGIAPTDDEVKAYVEDTYGEDSYEDRVNTYGVAYLKQELISKKVDEFCEGHATIQ